MVEKVEVYGRSLREVLDDLCLGPESDFRLVSLGEGPFSSSEERNQLARLRSLPGFDERSYLITGALGRKNRSERVLAVPRDCPYLGEDEGLPSEDVTYIAEIRKTGERRRPPISVLILADHPDQAQRVAENKAASILGDGSSYKIMVKKVSPPEFIDEGKRLIDQGLNLPSFILRYGGLANYAAQKRLSPQR